MYNNTGIYLHSLWTLSHKLSSPSACGEAKKEGENTFFTPMTSLEYDENYCVE
ncbi:hypothetical protein KIMH_05810 [Bombiscardovia apis]|uniref:Uncharacterized protein n=1 Tax=Bombiscardovia apis TaxID=2932182 RepID=A0ABM8BC25_9BIFI|nr:hypothetical protein KIMH_05810 [Bombiscardovia apis]